MLQTSFNRDKVTSGLAAAIRLTSFWSISRSEPRSVFLLLSVICNISLIDLSISATSSSGSTEAQSHSSGGRQLSGLFGIEVRARRFFEWVGNLRPGIKLTGESDRSSGACIFLGVVSDSSAI